MGDLGSVGAASCVGVVGYMVAVESVGAHWLCGSSPDVPAVME